MFYKKKGFKCAIVNSNTFRTGAFDSLRHNSLRDTIPFYGNVFETDPIKIAKDGVETFKKENYDLIIVDTSARTIQEESLFEEMKLISEAITPNDIILVMDSKIGQSIKEQVTTFKSRIPTLGSIILTKLDGHSKGGGAVSAIAATKTPISFIGTGEYYDSLQPFEVEGFVSRLLGEGNYTILFGAVQQAVDSTEISVLNSSLSINGVFTMRDLKEQLLSIVNMGPPSRVLSMIFGFSEFPKIEGQEYKVKKYLTIMGSMNETELDCADFTKLSDMQSRILRIARGSGKNSKDVVELLDNYKQFQSTSHPNIIRKKSSKIQDAFNTFRNNELEHLDWNGIMRQMGTNSGLNLSGVSGDGPQPRRR